MQKESIWNAENLKLINLFIVLCFTEQLILIFSRDLFLNSREISVFIFSFLSLLFFWFCAYRKDKNLGIAAAAFIIQMIATVPNIYPEYFINLLSKSQYFLEYYGFFLFLMNFLSFFIYAKFTYRSEKSFYFGFLGIGISSYILMTLSININFDIINFYKDWSFGVVKPSWFEFKLFGSQNVLELITNIGIKFAGFLAFLHFRQMILSKEKCYFNLTRIIKVESFPVYSTLIYITLLRLIIFSSSTSLISALLWNPMDAPLFVMTSCLFTFLILFVFSGIYRNLILAIFNQQNYQPSWFYLALNIPLVGLVLSWTLLNRKSKDYINQTSNLNDILDHSETYSLQTNTPLKYKSNNIIRNLLFVTSIVLLFIELYYYQTEVFGKELLYTFLILMIGFYLYFYQTNGLYIIVIAQMGAIFSFYFEPSAYIILFASSISTVILIVFYPVIHFKEFIFIPSETSNSVDS